MAKNTESEFPSRFSSAETAEDAMEASREWSWFCTASKYMVRKVIELELAGIDPDQDDEFQLLYQRFLDLEKALEEKWQRILRRLPSTGRPLRRVIDIEDLSERMNYEQGIVERVA